MGTGDFLESLDPYVPICPHNMEQMHYAYFLISLDKEFLVGGIMTLFSDSPGLSFKKNVLCLTGKLDTFINR